MAATVAVLYPRKKYERMEESYASWRAQSRLRNADEIAAIVFYDPDDRTADLMDQVDEPYVLVVLDPLIVPERDLATRLKSATGVIVARDSGGAPLFYFCASQELANELRPPRQALEGRATTNASFTIPRWRSDTPPDLEPYIPTTIHSLLHVACGDGALGHRIRQRQKCRVVGIEPHRDLAAIAKRQLDDVYVGDVEEVVSILNEAFECILANGILERTVDPWSLVASLRGLAKPDGILIMSLPNVGNAQVIADLIAGRFAVADSLRFFTRESIEELMDIAGWTIETMDAVTAETRAMNALRTTGLKMSDDLHVTRFIVVARNRRA